MTVIPSFLDDGSGQRVYDGNAWGNVRLRLGEVQEIVLPSNPRSLSKRFIEYTVLVQHLDNGTITSKMYNYCLLSNIFGGVADMLRYTLRATPGAGTTDSNKQPGPGKGAKVLLLCINGNHHNAVIIGGIRDALAAKDAGVEIADASDLGHNLYFEFNGVRFVINNDGELKLSVRGKTDADGKTAADVGTSISITKDGNVAIVTKDNTVVVNQADGSVNISAKKEVNVNGPRVNLGEGASHPAVQGDVQKELLGQILDEIAKIIVISPSGETSPPVNAPAFVALRAQLGKPLSDTVFVK